MPKSAIKALLFDMGGVVLEVDFEKVFQSWASMSALDELQIKSRFQMDKHYQQHEIGQLEASGFFDHLRQTLQLTATDEEMCCAWNAIFGQEITASLNAIDAVRHRIPTYGFTNTNRTHQSYWEHNFPRIRNTFEKLFVSSEMGLRKPDAEAFEFILNDISVEPGQLLFFDDSAENLEGAELMGIQTVLVTDSESVIRALNSL